MNQKLLCILLWTSLICTISRAQSHSLIVPDNIISPRDTNIRKPLIASIQGFLEQTTKPNAENTFVRSADLLETSALLDEMKDLGNDEKHKEKDFYKPYLSNIITLNDSSFIIQLSYMGIQDSTPVLKANFTFSAIKENNRFYFYSPLKQNTLAWKHERINNTTVFYKTVLNRSNAKAFFNMVADYDSRLQASDLPVDFYCADNLHEALQLIGVDYKSDYIGYARSSESAKENNQSLVVNGIFTADFTKFDPHDLWHDRLHKVLSTTIINRPVDEGTAYLYGGSWGLSWKEILDKFKAFAVANPNADWMKWYNESKNFDEKAKFPLNVDFVINALLVQKIEQEKGFSAVKELLSCGKKEKDNSNYFNALEKITGITKDNFNAKIQAIIEAG